MKKIILISALFIFTLTCKGQTHSIISYKDLIINGIEVYGTDKAVLLQKFGQPISITQEYFEMQKLYAQKYSYNGLYIYIVNNQGNDFEISNKNYSFSKYNIKVGDNISILKSYYPISYNNRNLNYMVIWVTGADAYVVFEFNNNNILTFIRLREN